ncbi:MAG TPA: SHOCT domain-containing protein [Brevundimonas sp.]|nr:SHOCT domain-containing protein [Brevundimonas sp.]
MDGAAAFTLVMLGLSFLPILIVPLILLFVVRAILRGKRPPSGRSDPSWSSMKICCGLLVLLGVSSFAGLMVATAGGAIHPPVITVAAPYVCDGTVDVRSQNYSYRPGQRGVARTILCTGADGEARDITLKTMGAATICYALIFLAVGLALLVLARLLTPRLNDALRTKAGGLSSKNAEAAARYLKDRLVVSADIVRRDAKPDSGDRDDTVRSRLENLQALRDDNLISEEEYQAKRAEVLSSL